MTNPLKPPALLSKWYVTNGFMVGKVKGHPKQPDGQIVTTLIQDIDFENRIVKTTNTFYKMGKKYGEKDTMSDSQRKNAKLRFTF